VTAKENSGPRTDVTSSVDYKSRQNQIKAHATDTHSQSPRSGLGTFTVVPRPLNTRRDMPNNTNPLGALSQTGYIRQSQLIPAIFPFSSATLWRKVKSGTFPQPVKLGPRITAWRVEDIRSLIERIGR
jgi:prophage regulatory protein